MFPKSQQLKIDQGVWQLNFFNEIEVFDSSIIFVQSVRNFSHCFTFITIMKRQKIGGLWVDHVHMAQYIPKDKLLLRYWNFDNAGTQLENDLTVVNIIFQNMERKHSTEFYLELLIPIAYIWSKKNKSLQTYFLLLTLLIECKNYFKSWVIETVNMYTLMLYNIYPRIIRKLKYVF